VTGKNTAAEGLAHRKSAKDAKDGEKRRAEAPGSDARHSSSEHYRALGTGGLWAEIVGSLDWWASEIRQSEQEISNNTQNWGSGGTGRGVGGANRHCVSVQQRNSSREDEAARGGSFGQLQP
jgi:hypothetical protein